MKIGRTAIFKVDNADIEIVDSSCVLGIIIYNNSQKIQWAMEKNDKKTRKYLQKYWCVYKNNDQNSPVYGIFWHSYECESWNVITQNRKSMPLNFGVNKEF